MSSEGNPYGLSDAEMAVLKLIADGLADDAIARRLRLDLPAVNAHVGGILRKMGARSRTEAGVMAIREGLV